MVRWAVSTGRAGYGTPSGTYRPQRMERSWFSKLYYNSPMPYSIFFHGGYAIHGSYEINRNDFQGPVSNRPSFDAFAAHQDERCRSGKAFVPTGEWKTKRGFHDRWTRPCGLKAENHALLVNVNLPQSNLNDPELD